MRYKFLGDPVFLISILFFSLNKFLISYTTYLLNIPFMTGYFNDFFLIPCVTPIILFISYKLGLRDNKSSPQNLEVFIVLTIFIVICEYIGPFLLNKGTYDLFDIFVYTLGGLISMIIWNKTSISYSY